MTHVKAFKAIRPKRDKAYLVASRSYLTYSESTLREKLLNNPYTFLHIINPEHSSNSQLLEGIDKYKMVRSKYKSFKNEGVFVEDGKPCFYIYQQVTEESTYTGLIATSSVDDYLSGHIKIHEQTIAKREAMFTDYLNATGFNAEPVLLTYKKTPEVDVIIEAYMKYRPEYEFTSTNKVLHNLWLVNKPKDIEALEQKFTEVDHMYIADGHHRCASSALLCQRLRQANPNYTGNEPYNFFMSYLIDHEQMRIFGYHRLITDLHGLSKAQFISKLGLVYTIQKLEVKKEPSHKDEICMYFDGCWYSLVARPSTFDSKHCVGRLDAAILNQNVLYPILGIKDIRNDKRVAFIDGKQGLSSLESAVDSLEFSIAFALKPISFDQLKLVADQNEIMPPKTTFIEPKLRSGLIIYSNTDEE